MSIESVLEEITALRNDIKTLSKIVRKVKAKQDDPNGEKAAKRAENNGFNRKQVISEKLRVFLELPEGELVSRSTVTRAINKYVNDKGNLDAAAGIKISAPIDQISLFISSNGLMF